MDNVAKVKFKIMELWKTHLKPKDFESKFDSYLKENKDWHKTSFNIKNDVLNVKLYYDEKDGYDITVKLKKPDNVNLK